MKKFIINLFILGIINNTVFSQITVQASMRTGAVYNVIEVLAKPTADIYAQVGNVNITFSIPDHTSGGGNPTDASIIKYSPLMNVIFIPTDEHNPYIIGHRAYYSYLILAENTDDDVPSMLTRNANNLIGSFTFPANYDGGIRLEDLSSTGGGPNGQMVWYIQFNEGIGDVTNYTSPFYSFCNTTNVINNNGGLAEQFVSLIDDQLVTLVVKFLSFSVMRQGNNAALITWGVENEGLNSGVYEIQESLNGVEFSLSEKVDALNNGKTSNSYSFTENGLSAFRTSGVIYFRIKQTDRDGKFIYSPVRSVRLNSSGLLVSAYPNPVKSNASVMLDLTTSAEIEMRLFDAEGRLMYSNKIGGSKGPNFTSVDMSKMALGTYTLYVRAGSEMKAVTLIKAEQ